MDLEPFQTQSFLFGGLIGVMIGLMGRWMKRVLERILGHTEKPL